MSIAKTPIAQNAPDCGTVPAVNREFAVTKNIRSQASGATRARKRWTGDEESEWLDYLWGRAANPPNDRTHDAAITHLRKVGLLEILTPDRATMHAASMAALRHLKEVPYRKAGSHLDFVEAVVSAALAPWKYDIPEDPAFTAAFREAREVFDAST